MPSPRFDDLSPAQAAELVGVSTDTIRRRIADGTLPARRFGPRLIKISREDLGLAFRVIPSARRGRGRAQGGGRNAAA